MTEREIEIRNRIAKDRAGYRDTVLSPEERHIVMNALWKLEALAKSTHADVGRD